MFKLSWFRGELEVFNLRRILLLCFMLFFRTLVYYLQSLNCICSLQKILKVLGKSVGLQVQNYKEKVSIVHQFTCFCMENHL